MNKEYFMKKIVIVVFGLLSLGQVAFAEDGLSGFVPASCTNSSDCTIDNVALSASAISTVQGRTSQLRFLGAGLRKVKVILEVPVYVGELFANDPTKFVRTAAGVLASLSAESTVAINMNFVHSASTSQLQSKFQAGLAANNVDQTSTEVAAFLTAVSTCGNAQSGDSVNVIGEKLSDGSEVITYSSSEGTAVSIAGPLGFVNEIMSIWVGDTSDDNDLTNAKNAMLIDLNLTN
jgi:hypothetical protein